MDTECKHDLPIGQCTICKGTDWNKKPVAGPVFHARYDGYCPGCEQPIYGGEEADGQLIYGIGRVYYHEGCYG